MMVRTPFALVRFVGAGTWAPAAGAADGSTANTLKFSSPSLSLVKRIYLLSQLQKYPETGRFFSAVSGRAFSNGSSTPLTQTLRTSLRGLMNEMYFPSGESWAPA